MSSHQFQVMLVYIKLIHSVIWMFYASVMVYLFYAVISDRVGLWFWIGIGAYALEFAVLVYYRWTCPLTFWARRYSNSDRDNFDIYLPNWLAKHNKTIFSILFALLTILYLYKFIL